MTAEMQSAPTLFGPLALPAPLPAMGRPGREVRKPAKQPTGEPVERASEPTQPALARLTWEDRDLPFTGPPVPILYVGTDLSVFVGEWPTLGPSVVVHGIDYRPASDQWLAHLWSLVQRAVMAFDRGKIDRRAFESVRGGWNGLAARLTD